MADGPSRRSCSGPSAPDRARAQDDGQPPAAIQAAIEGSGVTVGKWPHLARHLGDGALRAPFGADGVAHLGSFFLVVAPGSAGREPVAAFVKWLKDEARRDADPAPASARGARRAPRKLKPR